MFLLDTNVLSAMMAPIVPREVERWIAGTPLRFLYTATVCQAEILAGVAVLSEGRRRRDLHIAARRLFDESFDLKIWPFDGEAAEAYAEVVSARRRLGRRGESADLMIAAIALAHDASVVTRNVRDFDDCGIAIVNPWDE
jgi:toxin FitB